MRALPPSSVGFRPVRLIGNSLRTYTAFRMVRGRAGCERVVRTLTALGYVHRGLLTAPCLLDVLDETESIVAEVPITRDGFTYLRRQWRFTLEVADT